PYHWLTTLDALGAPDATVTGDIPTSAVFTKGSARTYAAHNHGATARTVTFPDGKTLTVPARSTATGTGSGTTDPDPAPDPDPEPPTGSTSQPRSGATLTTATDRTAGSDTIASAGATNHAATPYRPPLYEVRGVNGTLTPGAQTAFRLQVDAGTTVGLGQQARVSYDLTGDGDFERTETYHYFATDPVTGWEEYTQARGLKAATGTPGDLKGGTVRLEVWSAIGNGTSQLRTGTDGSVGEIPCCGSRETRGGGPGRRAGARRAVRAAAGSSRRSGRAAGGPDAALGAHREVVAAQEAVRAVGVEQPVERGQVLGGEGTGGAVPQAPEAAEGVRADRRVFGGADVHGEGPRAGGRESGVRQQPPPVGAAVGHPLGVQPLARGVTAFLQAG